MALRTTDGLAICNKDDYEQFFDLRTNNGMGTIISERVYGTDEDCNVKIVELRKEYGGFYSCQVYEDGIKIYDSAWNAN